MPEANGSTQIWIIQGFWKTKTMINGDELHLLNLQAFEAFSPTNSLNAIGVENSTSSIPILCTALTGKPECHGHWRQSHSMHLKPILNSYRIHITFDSHAASLQAVLLNRAVTWASKISIGSLLSLSWRSFPVGDEQGLEELLCIKFLVNSNGESFEQH
ncbi:hypothetical protein HPP92_018521 [Vanilla planifolia]|uniref:Uncharacterized protein n=1 Tax=Vanilla planifolia TaxID=51239 RepID=A0A835UPL2_VANPL|nr:hypothetical protein HPP92_018521 [Vanilla planifolia]